MSVSPACFWEQRSQKNAARERTSRGQSARNSRERIESYARALESFVIVRKPRSCTAFALHDFERKRPPSSREDGGESDVSGISNVHSWSRGARPSEPQGSGLRSRNDRELRRRSSWPAHHGDARWQSAVPLTRPRALGHELFSAGFQTLAADPREIDGA